MWREAQATIFYHDDLIRKMNNVDVTTMHQDRVNAAKAIIANISVQDMKDSLDSSVASSLLSYLKALLEAFDTRPGAEEQKEEVKEEEPLEVEEQLVPKQVDEVPQPEVKEERPPHSQGSDKEGNAGDENEEVRELKASLASHQSAIQQAHLDVFIGQKKPSKLFGKLVALYVFGLGLLDRNSKTLPWDAFKQHIIDET